MKKIIFFIILLIPINVFAYTGPLDEQYFNIGNQTTSPFTINVDVNSSTNVTFHLVDDWNHGSGADYDLVGSYLFFSVVSNQPIDIHRRYSYGTNCNTSCFSNDDYLQLIDDTNGYSYVYYFNIVKWAVNVGTQIDLYNVDDQFTFVNKGSSNATIYVYGSYADSTNQIPQYINNANTTQQIIIDGQTNRDMIIDSQNQNTQDIISTIEDNFKTCKSIDYSFSNSDIEYSGKYLSSNGDLGSSTSYGVSYYYEILPNASYQYTSSYNGSNNVYFCTYDSNKNRINCYKFNNQYSWTFSTGSNVKYFRTTLPGDNISYSLRLTSGQICTNKLDDSTNAINDINSSINNSGIDNPNSDFSDMEDMIAHNGVITNLIALPITLYTSILNGLNQSCSEYNFGQLFGSDLKFQCINLGALLGNTIWGVIDVLFSGFTIYKIAKKMIKVFNNFSGLNEGDVIDD